MLRVQHESDSGQERRQSSVSYVEMERRSGEDQRVLRRGADIDKFESTLAEPYFSAMRRRRTAREERQW